MAERRDNQKDLIVKNKPGGQAPAVQQDRRAITAKQKRGVMVEAGLYE